MTFHKQSGCNSRDKNDGPLDNKYQTTRLIHRIYVTINADDEYELNLGLTETISQNDLFINHKIQDGALCDNS